MAHLANSNWFQNLEQERQKKRACKQFTVALAHSTQLNLHAPSLVLAALLNQPLHLSNEAALQHWVMERLEIEGIEADQEALLLLSNILHRKLSEVVA